MVGDGHLGFHSGIRKNGKKFVKYEIIVSGNSKEKDYMVHVANLFQSLFNLRLHYKEDSSGNGVMLRAYSKGVNDFLNKICGLPHNKKTNLVRIPQIIKSSGLNMKYAFLRGLADTDYSVTFKNKTLKGHSYPVIKGAFKSKNLVIDLERLYADIGFRYCTQYDTTRYDKRFGFTTINIIYLNGKNNFIKWVNRIGFSNRKFQRKVEKWQIDGICPPGY
jgi:intein/homing endonuclease